MPFVFMDSAVFEPGSGELKLPKVGLSSKLMGLGLEPSPKF